jgi:WD40 repeat protein
MDAIQFIQAFAPIISKAAMQTYLSALPLISSVSLLLFSTYSAMSRLSIQLWRPRRSGCRIIHRPQAIFSTIINKAYDSTTSDNTLTLALPEGAASFKDSRSRNKNSPHAKEHYRCITFSPDGQWIATENKDQRGLDIWNVETLSYAKTIAKGCVELDFDFITYSADGKKVMIVPSFHSNISRRAFFIWDVETDKLVRRVSTRRDISKIAISPDQSQLAIVERYISHIRIIDVSTGRHMGPPIRPYGGLGHYSIDRLIWAPNGQFLATVNSVFMKDFFERREIHLLSLSGEVVNPSLGSPTPDQIIGLAYSPDSLKIIAIYRDDADAKHEKKLSIWCTQTGNLIATTSFEFNSEEVTIAFTSDEDILVCGYDLDWGTIVLLRFNVVPTHSTRTYTYYPPKFDPSEPPLTIAYSHDTSGVIVDYASHVDADGWILNTKGERQIWTPWANHELSHSRETPREGHTEYRILEVKNPETKIVVLRYVIAFEDVKSA